MAMRDYILHNFWWKLLSLLLAALTWLTIQTALQRERNLPPVVGSYSKTFPAVPITLMTAPTNTSRFNVTPTTVKVDISGPEDQLSKLQESDVHAFVDLTDVGDEKQLRRPIQAQVPKGLKVDSLQPANASVERISNPQTIPTPSKNDSP